MSDEGAKAHGDTSRSELTPAVNNAFTVLGDETRLRILLELTDVAAERGLGSGLSFSELRSRVGVDDSGRFNYHLDQLRDGFVSKTDEGYSVDFPGMAVVSAVYAGRYTDVSQDNAATKEIDRECQFCSSRLTLHYEGNSLWIECDEHGQTDTHTAVPPGAAHGRTLEELAETVYSRLLVNLLLARRGICLQCWGTMIVDYPVDSDVTSPVFEENFVLTELNCERCWNHITTPLRTVIATHPLVIGAFRTRGYDLRDIVQSLVQPDEDVICAIDLHESEPPRATATLTIDDVTLEMELDESATVLEYDWRTNETKAPN